MADSLLAFGVEKFWDLLVRESERFQGVQEQFDGLKSEVEMLRCFLEDAHGKKHTSAMVRKAVKNIKEIVYDAEDIIETFLLKEELSKTNGIKKHIRQLAWVITDRRGLAIDMESLSKRITKVIRDMQTIGVQRMIVNGGEYSHPLQERHTEMRKTFPISNEDNLVGLEENVKKLVGYLVEEERIKVVSITGMGGIGKTTLARQVFNDKMVKNHFDGVVWVCISQQFSRKDVWQTILQKLSSKHDEQRDPNMNEGELQDKLFRLLEISKYLIVLDDMWKEEDWERIELAFPLKKGYWKVLLTSRNEKVGLRVDPKCVTFKPECLTIEESWTLFQRIALPINDASESKVDEEMEKMGKQMIKHCGGLPLAVRVLGGLLAVKYTSHEWKRVSENIGYHLVERTNSNNGSIDQVLSMSFEELPSYLKHCFLYLAHFPEDYPINVANLSYYWAAEGIPRPRGYDGATIQEVTDEYIEELVKRNMVVSVRDKLTSRFETCELHDMMREVCVRKAEEENFVHIVDAANSQSPCKSRRIIIHELDESYDPKGMMKNPKLRSLLFINSAENGMLWDLIFTRLQLLRVLDLPYAEFKGGKLPSSIGKLIHLRYLSLFRAKVTHLPSSMRNLKLLIYLNLGVSVSSPIYMPNNVLNEMRELTCLYLPLFIHDKVKIELDNLVNLENLYDFSTKHNMVRDLHRMTRLQTLIIKFNGGCTVEALSSSLSELSHLENLTIDNATNGEEGFVLDCVHLKHLKLWNMYMPMLHFPSHLTTLSLSMCCLEEDPMPILEKLLQLKEVCLYYQSFVAKRMVCSGNGFPQLQKLLFSFLEEWEEWIVEEGSMPLLHTLTIKRCSKLKELPDGLRFITSMKELKINTLDREFKEKLSEGGEDFYKVQHIPLLKIELDEERWRPNI